MLIASALKPIHWGPLRANLGIFMVARPAFRANVERHRFDL
jgi:hypothetical protein